MIERDVSFFTVDLIRHWKANAEKEANERIEGIIPSESIPFTLRELYDDLETCCKMINYINTFDTAVVVPPSSFPVTSEYEKKIESIVDAIGMNYASRMRRCFAAIFNFRGVVEEEYPRHKNCLGCIADAEAVRYSHRLNAFLSQMEEYDIHELVDTIRKLFKV